MNKFEKCTLLGVVVSAVTAVIVPAVSVVAGLFVVPFLALFLLSQCAPADDPNN